MAFPSGTGVLNALPAYHHMHIQTAHWGQLIPLMSHHVSTHLVNEGKLMSVCTEVAQIARVKCRLYWIVLNKNGEKSFTHSISRRVLNHLIEFTSQSKANK